MVAGNSCHAQFVREINYLREFFNVAPHKHGCKRQIYISVFLFNVDGLEALNTGTILDVDYNIASRTGLHCAPLVHEQIGTAEIHGAVRFGVGPFNTEEHIATAIQAVKEIAESRRK